MKIALIGYGKMGKEIEKIAIERGHEVILKIDKDNTELLQKESLSAANVAIEFTTPETALANYMRCFEAQIPVVSGTTGWLAQMPVVEAECGRGSTFFYASNFSIGVNVFFEINQLLAKLMQKQPEYSVELEEIHHTQKLDSPSGTALTLANEIIAQLDRKTFWSETDSKAEDCLPITAKRIADVPGIHTVTYDSEVDEIRISHRAKSRKGFALGAVLAAEFVVGRTGLYSMKDLLRL